MVSHSEVKKLTSQKLSREFTASSGLLRRGLNAFVCVCRWKLSSATGDSWGWDAEV